jgi:hypothetical protein
MAEQQLRPTKKKHAGRNTGVLADKINFVI